MPKKYKKKQQMGPLSQYGPNRQSNQKLERRQESDDLPKVIRKVGGRARKRLQMSDLSDTPLACTLLPLWQAALPQGGALRLCTAPNSFKIVYCKMPFFILQEKKHA